MEDDYDQIEQELSMIARRLRAARQGGIPIPQDPYEKLEPPHQRDDSARRSRPRDPLAAATPKLVSAADDFPDDPPLSDEDFAAAFLEWQRAFNQRFRTSLTHQVAIETAKDGKPIAVAFPSDWHIGSSGVDHERIITDVGLISSHPRLFCCLGGDPVDNFIIEKMINASRTMLIQPDAQWTLFRWLINKLVESQSLLFVGTGNHDQWTEKVAGFDGVSAALRGLPAINTGEGGHVTVMVGAQRYSIYRKHKPTRFNSSQNPTHFLKQMLRMGTSFDFDIGVSEHFHNCNIELGEWRPGSGSDRIFITTGSYKVRDPWAESLGYYGGGYGVPVVVLFPDRHEMMPFKRLSQAITVLNAYS